MFYRARHYSQSLGRFLQRDPIGYYDALNLYQYTLNSPVNYTDPSGEIIVALPWWLIWTGVIGGGYAIWNSIRNWQGGFYFPDMHWPWQLPTFPLLNSEGGNFCLFNARNRIPDKGVPGTVATNGPGTTKKIYGDDGWVTKEWNKGHPDAKHKGKAGGEDHVHDYIPNPKNPSGKPIRQPARKPTPQDDKDFGNS